MQVWEERWHPLREEWVIVAAHRQDRPWSGKVVQREEKIVPPYAADCYLCPGNSRVSGARNPDYSQTFVFDNDHPSVALNAPQVLEINSGIYRNRPAHGIARVVCYSPKHNLSLGELELDEIVTLLRVWQEQYRELSARPDISHVLIFENKGEVVGVSNPHPHCQIYATNFVFKTIETEALVGQRYLDETGNVLFQVILKAERDDGGESSVRTIRRSLSSPIFPVTRTNYSSRRRRPMQVSRASLNKNYAISRRYFSRF